MHSTMRQNRIRLKGGLRSKTLNVSAWEWGRRADMQQEDRRARAATPIFCGCPQRSVTSFRTWNFDARGQNAIPGSPVFGRRAKADKSASRLRSGP